MATTKKSTRHCQWCSGINCSNSRLTRPDLAFFKFPRDKERSKRWVINCRRADLDNKPADALNRGNVLCQEHFEPSCYNKCRTRTMLFENAVPTIFSNPNPPPKIGLSRPPPRQRPSRAIETSASNDNFVQDNPKITTINEDGSASLLKRKLNAEKSKVWRLKKKLSFGIAGCFKIGTTRNFETQSLIRSGENTSEPDYESQTVKEEPNEEEESDMSPVIKSSPTNSPSLSCPEENSFLYCEKCQLKYEGGCPDHGPLSYIDNYEVQTVKKEAGEEEKDMSLITRRASPSSPSMSCYENSFLYCEKCQMEYEGGCPEHGHLIYMDNAEEGQGEACSQDSHPQVQEVDNKDRQVLGREKMELSNVCETHSDDVGTLPNGGCSTESDQMFSVCEMNTELCVDGTSCGVQSNAEIKAGQKIHNTRKPFSCDVYGFTQFGNLNRHENTSTGESDFKCDVCGLGVTHQGNVKADMRTHTGEKYYMCDVCDVGFVQSYSVNRHKIRHTGEKSYKCDVCGLEFNQPSGLSHHRRTHRVEKLHLCDVCGLGFNQPSGLSNHRRTHRREKLHLCDVCGVGFLYSDYLKEHMRSHTGEKPYKCEICGRRFAQRAHLNVHNRTHTGEKPYICDVCGVGFSQSGEIQTHMRRHTGEKPFKCDVCGVGFILNRSLKSHKRTHTGEKPYKCEICGRRFAQSANLNVHNRTHTGEKPFNCNVCGVRFTQSNRLKGHERTHTGETPYKCDVCGAGFGENSKLISHKRTHTGEKPYKCDVCGVGFGERSNLIRHKITHTGEKPYACDVCGTRFTQFSNLKVHIRKHTGEKPYKCDVCGVGYRENSGLIRHKRTHTGEKPYKCDV